MKKTNKTKLLGVLLAAVLLIAMICTFVLMAGAQEGDACASTADCTGTYENGICTQCDAYESATLNAEGYYEISNAGQLYWFAAEVNSGSTDINGELTANIVVNENVLTADGTLNGDSIGFRAWTPIGNEEFQFYGTFDGGEYTISGLYFNNPEQDDVGLFGYTASDATVQNVGVIDSYFNGDWYVGGVVGSNYGNVENCYNTGTVSGKTLVGGVVGDNHVWGTGTVQSCYNAGDVSGVGSVGGVVGNNSRTVENCYNTGMVSGNIDVGGVAGTNDGTVQSSYNTGTVSGDDQVGGVVGLHIFGTVRDSYNTGEVSGTSDVGGVVGKDEIDSVVESCYYLSDSETDEIDGTTAKTAAQFASCEVCDGVGFHVFGDNGLCLVCNGGFERPEQNVDGTYLIQTPGNLLWYAQAFNAELLEPYSAMLTADIEIPAGMVWTPIGSYDNPYCLTFDGQGYTISGLTVQDGSYVGLFGAANEHATVRNLGVVNSTIAGTDFAGGIVGYNRGVVDNVYVYEVSVSGSGYAGGIAGYHAGNLTDSFAVATVTGAEKTGITVGYNAGTAEDVYAFESVEDEALLSGKLAVLLGEGWYQQLGSTGDVHPVLRGYDSVHYYIQDGALCTSEYFVYTNHDQEDGTLLHDQAAEHDENGFCTNVHCGGYEQPAQNADGYYEIDNAGKLYWFMEHVNAGNEAASAILTEDIVVNEDVLVDGALNSNTEGFREWFPIGYHFDRDGDGEAEDVFYIGTFDGNGHTVSGLYFNREIQSYVGLFGQTFTGATVQNVGVIDSYFNGDYYVGGVVGINNAAVENCYSTGSVSGMAFVGGLVGVNNSSIENCYSTGSVSGRDYVGGVAGYTNGGNVENCYNAGLVSGTNYVGGVIGSNDNTTVENCYYLDTCGAAGDGTSVNVERFASGEIAFLLGDAFGQKLGSDSYPVFVNSENTNKVYRKGDCATGTATYSNDPAQSSPVEHTFTEESNGFCEVCGAYQPADYVDVGTGYYEISNAGQLYWFAEYVNAGNTNENAILTADIVVNKDVLAEMAKDQPNTEGFRAWTPIGTSGNPYNGSFNGNGHTISGLYFNVPNESYVGLFGCTASGANISYVGVIDSYFNAYDYVGGIVGYNQGLVGSCYSESFVSGNNYVGGVVGDNSGTVQNCYNVGDVSGTSAVGGVVGFNGRYGSVYECYNEGTVNGNNSVGGVVGYNSYTVQNCYNVGEVRGDSRVGGVVGYNDSSSTVQNCYNVGAVNGNIEVGGVVGNNDGTVQNCYNTGDVSGNAEVGGVVGNTYTAAQNCYYLTGTASGGMDGADAAGQAEAKSAAQFASGEVAYLLNGGKTDGSQVWYQTLGEQSYPTLDSEQETVYLGGTCTDRQYSNDATVTHDESVAFENGFCPNCDAYEQPDTVEIEGVTYYAIDNAGKLYWFMEHVNAGNTSVNAILTKDIMVNRGVLNALGKGLFSIPFRAWTPIGNNNNKYAGTFDGDGHKVSGLYFSNPEQDYVGLFGYTASDATVQNVGVIDSYFNSDLYVGGVVGYNEGTVESCYNMGTVSGDSYVGGVVGYNRGTVESCYNTGSVSGNSYVGGVVGTNRGTVENCYNTGTVSGASQVGGVVGSNDAGTVQNCYNTGSVNGSRYYTGGVIGLNIGGTTENCYNTGTVSGIESVGGVVGYNYNRGTTKNCYNVGSVSGESYVGGVVGENGSSTVENCYYLTGTASGGINGADAAGQAEAKSAAQFASGEVAYLLNGDQTEIVFGQTLGKDDAPTLGGKQVYELDPTCNADQVKAYSNVYLDPPAHAFVNGFCTECDAFQPAVYNEEKGYYEISNAGQLYWFAGLVNGTLTDGTAQNTSANAVLTADIVVNEDVLAESGALNGTGEGFRVWAPIGNGDSQYAGTFDGNGHTVSGLYFNDENQNYVGMFGLLTFGSDVIVQNVGVIDSYFRGDSGVGGVVGYNTGTVQNCYNAGTVTGSSYTGGVIGENSGTVEGSYNTGTVNGSVYAGGVVGYNNGTVENCYNAGAVSSETAVGGVAGFSIVGTVQNSYNTGTVSGNYNVGGVVGYYAGGTMQNCYNVGIVDGDSNAGGVVGYHEGDAVENCFYLSDTETDEIDGTTAKTWAQFASGEVAYLLGEGFGQEIGKDQLPVLGGTQVYAYTGGTCSAPDTRYTNDAQLSGQEHYEHDKITGFDQTEDGKMVCAVCGREAVAEVVDDFGEKYHFVDLKTALEYAADSGRGYVVLLCDVTEDVQISEYDELVLDLNGYALAEGITLTLGEGSILTLTNGKVYADMTGQQPSLLILGENVRVYGEINTEGDLELGAPVMGDIDITKVQSIRESNGYQLTVNDLAALQLGLTEGDVIVVDENGNVYFGELKIELAETEGAYTGQGHLINVRSMWIGNTSVYNATAYYDGPIIDIGEYELEIELSNMRLVYTADGSDTLSATYTVTKGQLGVNHGPYASHPFGTDRTTAHVRGEMFLLGAAEYTAVPGTFGAVTQNEAGGYEVVFTPDDTDTYEITTVTLEDIHFATEAVLPENVTVILPDWVGIGEHVTLDHTAVNPHSGEKIENVTYEYYVGELHDSVQWNAIPGNQFTPSASVGEQVYIRVVVPNLDGQYHAAVSEPVLVTVVNVADQVADLEQAVDELGDAVASGEASIAEINDAMQAVQQRLDVLEAIGTGDRLDAAESAIAALQSAVEAINAKLEGIDTAQIATNKNDIADLNATVAEVQQTLAALGEKDSELAAAIEQTNASLAALQSELSALEERVTANEQAIAALEQAIDALNALIANKADASEIAAAFEQINTRLAALEEIEIPSLDAVNARMEQLDAAIKAIDLSGIEANAAEITALKQTVEIMQQSLTALANKDSALYESIQSLNTNVMELIDALLALEERVTANEQAIAELEQAVSALNVAVTQNTNGISDINAAMNAVRARLETLEALDAGNRLNAAEDAIRALDAAIKAIDLGGIEANAAEITALKSTVTDLQQILTALGVKDAELEGSLAVLSDELNALAGRVAANEQAIAELGQAIDALEALVANKADAKELATAIEQINQRLVALEGAQAPGVDLNQINARVTQLEATIKAMDLSGINLNRSDIEDLKKQLQYLQGAFDNYVSHELLESEIAMLNASINVLRSDLDGIISRLDQVQEDMFTLQVTIRELSELVNRSASMEELENELQRVYQAMNAMKEEYSLVQDEFTSEILGLKATIENIDLAGIQTNKADIEALRVSLNELQALLAGYATKEEMAAAVDALNASIDSLQSDLSALEERVVAAEQAIKDLEADIDALNALVANKADANEIAAAIEQINTRLAALESAETPEVDLSAVNAAIAELDAAIKAIDLSGINQNSEAIAKLNATAREMQTTLAALGNKDAELAAAIAQTNASLATLSDKLTALAERVAANEQAIAELEKAVEELSKIAAGDTTTIAQINQALADVQGALDRLESLESDSRLEAVEAKIPAIHEAIASINAKLEGVSLAQIDANKTAIVQLSATVTEVQSTLEALGAADAELAEGMTALQGKLTALEARVEANEKAIAALTEAVDQLNALVADKSDLEAINAAMQNVQVRLAALENAGISADVQAQLDSLQNAVDAIDLSGIETNAQAITELQNTVAGIQTALASLGDKDAELAASLAALQSDLSALTERVGAAEQAIKDLAADVDALNALVANKADASEIATAIEQINQRLAALESAEVPEVDLSAVNAAIAELDAAIKAIDLSGINQNSEAIVKLNATAREMQTTLTSLGNKDAELAAAIEQTNASLATLSDKLTALAERVAANEQAIAELEKAVEELSRIAAGDTTTIAQINQALADVQAALDRLEGLESNSRLEAVEAEIPAINEAIASINQKLDGVNLAQIDANKTAIAQLSETAADLQSALEALGAADAELAEGMTALQGKLTALEARVEANEKAIAELEAAIETLNALVADKSDVEAINAALALVQTRLEALEQSGVSADVENAISSLQQAVAGINAQLADADLALIAANEQGIAQLRETAAGMQSTLESLGNKDAELAAEMQTLRTDLGTLTQTAAKLESEIEEIRAAIDGINSAIEALQQADTEDADALASAMDALEGAIEQAKGLATQADDALKSELTSKIEAADQALDAAVKAMRNELNATKAELESALGEIDSIKGELESVQEDLAGIRESMDQHHPSVETETDDTETKSGGCKGIAFTGILLVALFALGAVCIKKKI